MIEKLIDQARRHLAEYECVSGLGVAIGGPLDAQRGIVYSPPNLPGWDKVPLKQRLSDALHLPVSVEHDAAACALAEYHWGAGRGAHSVVYLTCGTGFGAGFVLAGRIYYGRNGRPSDLGHIRYRKDGRLVEVMTLPKKMQNNITSRIKIMAKLDIAEKAKPQDGKFQMKLGNRAIDFRISILPVVWGEKTVFRILDSSNLALDIGELGFEPTSMEDFTWACSQPYGMVLVTGPTGSGKSTTLYSGVSHISEPEINIVTVEDPVEYTLAGVNQVPVNPKRGMTFSNALRSILRQDPDVILLGEIRDKETLEIAVKAALTGHLVLSTLHTNDAASTITRMVDMGMDSFLVASSTLLICAQRLVRALCPHCKKVSEYDKKAFLSVGFAEEELARPDFEIFEPVGCNRCTNGYRGRFAILETMRMSEAIKRLVVEKAHIMEIKSQALSEGMLTLRRCGLLNVIRGKTSIEEVERVTMAD